jgi:hypothetical protein
MILIFFCLLFVIFLSEIFAFKTPVLNFLILLNLKNLAMIRQSKNEIVPLDPVELRNWFTPNNLKEIIQLWHYQRF